MNFNGQVNGFGQASEFVDTVKNSDVGGILSKGNGYLDAVVARVVNWAKDDDNADLVTTINKLAYVAIGVISAFYMLPATLVGFGIGAVAGKEFISEEKGFLTHTYQTIGDLMTESTEDGKEHLGSRAALAATLGAGALWMAPSILGLMWGADAGARLSQRLFPGASEQTIDSRQSSDHHRFRSASKESETKID